jgi:hypothetical protein
MSAIFTLSSAIYPPACFHEAAAAYQGLCQVKIVGETLTGYAVEIRWSAGVSDEEQLRNEFLNYLLDLSLEKHLAELQQEGHGTD